MLNHSSVMFLCPLMNLFVMFLMLNHSSVMFLCPLMNLFIMFPHAQSQLSHVPLPSYEPLYHVPHAQSQHSYVPLPSREPIYHVLLMHNKISIRFLYLLIMLSVFFSFTCQSCSSLLKHLPIWFLTTNAPASLVPHYLCTCQFGSS